MIRIGSLCTGYGGLDMAVESVLGGELAWVADNDPGAAKILAHRFPSVPNLGDITGTDWAAVEPVDVLTAGFPCQDISCAGKRAGLREGTRSGLWAQVARAIAALRPPLVVIENVKELLSERADSDMEQCPWCLGDTSPESAMRALGAVLADLAEIGFDAEWVSLPAAAVGACHLRWRVFILAWPTADAQGVGPGEPADEADTLPGSRDTRAVPGGRGARAVADAERHGWPGRSPRTPGGPDTPGAGSRAAAAGRGAGAAAGAERERREGREPAASGGGWCGSPGSDRAPADTTGDGRNEVGPRADVNGGSVTAKRGHGPAAHAEHGGRDGGSPEQKRGPLGGVASPWDSPGAFGRYEAAVRQHERAFGRRALSPVEPGRKGDPRLSPRFVEWMQGLPDGWVTDVPGMSRNAKLKALGNGVVRQQAAMALRLLLGALEAGAAA